MRCSAQEDTIVIQPKGTFNLQTIITLFLFIILFMYLLLVMLDLHCFASFSLVVASRGYSDCDAQDFHCRGFSRCKAQTLECSGFCTVVAVHGFTCSVACGIFPDQRSNPCLLHWQEDS